MDRSLIATAYGTVAGGTGYYRWGLSVDVHPMVATYFNSGLHNSFIVITLHTEFIVSLWNLFLEHVQRTYSFVLVVNTFRELLGVVLSSDCVNIISVCIILLPFTFIPTVCQLV